MTPDDVRRVQRSWRALRRRRAALLAGLTRHLAASAWPGAAAERAGWLVEAVDELVGLLPAPSGLAARACGLAATWPDPCRGPSFAAEGRAWMGAAGDCLPTWSATTERAWREAWFLLSDVLAAETLSPFADEPPPP